MTDKMKRFVNGILRDMVGAPLHFIVSKPEPVAYLYNDVRLPKLPEWDEKIYPYAYLCTVWTESNRIAHLFVAAEPMAVVDSITTGGFEGYISSCGKEIACKEYKCNIATGTEWADGARVNFVSQTTFVPFWANTDMEKYLYDNGESTGTEDDVYTQTGEIGFYKSAPEPCL